MSTQNRTPSGRYPAGYAGHVKGSRVEDVHRTFDKKGREAAIAHGEKLGLKRSTVTQWTYRWMVEARNAEQK